MAIRALIFDLDETLLFEEASVHAALIETAKMVQTVYGIEPANLAQFVRTRARELWRSYPSYEACMAIGISSWEGLATHFVGDSPLIGSLRQLVPAYRLEAWKRALHDAGVDDESLVSALAETFPTIRREKHIPFPETHAVLSELKKCHKLGMITNGPSEHQREKLAHAGLEEYFDDIVVSGELGIGKPDARIFHHALNNLKVSPKESVMIGDSLGRDILGASNVGLRSIWINRNGAQLKSTDPVPDVVISDLRELHLVLDKSL